MSVVVRAVFRWGCFDDQDDQQPGGLSECVD
jgi:hypothetical protein